MSRITAEANPLGTFDYAYVDNVGGSSKGTTRLSSITYPNSQVTNFSWYGNTGDQRLQQITNLNPSSAVLSQFTYGYDSAGEITQWQQQQNGNSLNYNLGYDLAGQLTSAQAGGGNTPPAYAKEYYYAYDSASNRTGVQTSAVDTARIGGTVTSSDVVTISVKDSGLSGGTEAVNYTVQVGDTAAKIAVGLATAIDTDTNLQGIGVSAFANGSNEILNIKSASTNVTTYAGSLSGGATETIAFGIFKNGVENATIAGSKTTGDTITIKVYDPALSGGSESVTYTVLSGDTIDSIATGVKSAINADTSLSTLGCTATVASNVVSISSTSKNLTTYTESTSSGATETVSLALDVNSPEVISIAGTKTTSDVLTVVFVDAGLSGGKESVSYTVLSGDSLSSMTAGLTSAINADTSLQAIGVSATSSGTQATVQSNSPNLTAYRQSTSSGATETIGLTQPLYSWQTAVIGGSKTTGNVLTINVFDQALSGGKETVSYTVLSGDNLTSIAAALASAINGDSNLSAIGVSATSNSTVLSIESLSPNVTTYSQSVSSGATETIALGTNTGVIQSAYNNVNELVSQAPGGATRFKATTNKAVKSASVAGQTVTISSAPANPTDFSTSVVGTPTETITLTADPYQSGNATVTIGGTTTAGDTVTISANNVRLDGVPTSVSYTVKAGDTTSSIAYGLILAIFASSILRYTVGITYSYTSGNTFMLVPIAAYTYYPYGDSTVYTTSVTGVPTETLVMAADQNGNTTATVAGTVTVGDQLSITVQNANLSGGQEVISYTTTSGDTTTSVATALKTAINADTSLQNINLSATSSSGVVTIAAAPTTYTESTSGGATETITLGSNSLGNSTAVIAGTKTTGDTLTITAHNAQLSGGSEAVTYTVLSGDDLVKIAAGLAAAINADTHLQTLGVSASNSNAASLAMSQNFSGNGILPGGASMADVSATDAVPNVKTNGYAVLLNSGSSTSLTFDANGNMTQDQAGNTYSWDCENRLVSIVYPASGNHSDFTYDGLDNNVKILEYVSGSLSSTNQFVWDYTQEAETRDASGTITAQFFPDGETIGGTSYYVTKDVPGSVREMYASGLQAQYRFDPFGRVTKISESVPSDFGFGGYYLHARSGLNLTKHRAYDSALGMWLSRDPLGESVSPNLYNYGGNRNNPINYRDPLGLDGGSMIYGPYPMGQLGGPGLPEDPINAWIDACGRVRSMHWGPHSQNCPIPHGCPGNQAPVPDPSNMYPVPNPYQPGTPNSNPGSPPWDPTATKPWRGLA